MSRWVSILDAASFLGVTERQVNRIIGLGYLRCLTLSERRRMVDARDVLTYAGTRGRMTRL